MNQIDAFARPFPAKLHQRVRHKKAKEATERAESESPRWSEIATDFLLSYSLGHSSFLIEEAIRASKGSVPEPPTTKAWGGVVLGLARQGKLQKVGYSTFTRNACPKILWSKK